MTQLIDDIHFRLPVFECISIIIPSLHTKNSARRHTIPMKLLWHLADMPTMFGKSWRSIVPFAFCTMRIFVIPRVRSVVCYQLCCTDIPCMCTGIASYLLMQSDYVSDRPPSGHERLDDSFTPPPKVGRGDVFLLSVSKMSQKVVDVFRRYLETG